MPESVKEYKFAIFEARRHSDTKADHVPLMKMSLTNYKDMGLGDEGAMASYLEQKFGSGRFLIEPLDEHGRRLERAPAYVVSTGDEEDMLDDDEDDDYVPRRRRHGRSRRRFTDDELDDDDEPRSTRANLGDLVTTLARRSSADNASAAQQGQQLATAMLLSQKEDAGTRAQMEMRREELAQQMRREEREERRRDEEKAELRRQEERIEERRRQDKLDETKREERRAEEARAEERRREERAEEARRQEESNRKHLAEVEAANRRADTQAKLLIAAIPVIEKLLNRPPPEDTLKPLILSKLTEKPQPDAMTMMILKDTLEKKSSGVDAVQSVVQAMMVGQQASMEMTNQVNGALMKRVMDMALAGPGGENKDWAASISTLVDSAGNFMENAFGGPQQVVVQQPAQQPARRLPHNRVATNQQQQQGMKATTQPATQPGQPPQPATAQQQQQPARTWEQLTPEEQAAEQAKAPHGVLAVMLALKAVHTKAYETPQQHQQLVTYLLQELPLDVRVAILEKNQPLLLEIVKPTVDQVPELVEWTDKMSTLLWMQEFIPQLVPHIIAMYGELDVQKQQLAQIIADWEAEQAKLAAQASAPAPAGAPVVEGQPAAQPGVTVAAPAPTETAAAPTEAAPTSTETAAAPVASDAPSVATPAVAPVSTGSHLDPDNP